MNAAAQATATRTQRQDGCRHQVILVREQDAQHSGSGCCGRLGAGDSALGAAADFSHSRRRMEHIGAVYRALAERAPDIELIVVDPRNIVWLYPAVWRAARRQGLGVAAILRSLTRAGAPVAVVVDGDTLFSGRLPTPDRVVEAVLARLSG